MSGRGYPLEEQLTNLLLKTRNHLIALKAVALVGGESRRMGRPKQVLRRGVLTLSEIAVAAVERRVEQVVLAGDGPVPTSLDGLERLSDPPEVAGPLGGILAAMRFDPFAAWIVLACDMPFVSSRAVAWLLAQRRPDVRAILPQIDAGRVEPLLALYEPEMKKELECRAKEGRFGFQDLAGSDGIRCPAPPEGIRQAWTNVNTLEEFRDSVVIDV